MTKYKLKGLQLDEISLVDVPADPNAKITVWKRSDKPKDDHEKMRDRYKDMPPELRERMKKLMDDDMSEEDAYKAVMNETAKGGSVMDPKELATKVEALEGQVTDLSKKAETAEAQLAAFEKAATEAGFTVDKSDDGVTLTKAADPEYVEIDGERVEKSAVHPAILKRLEKQEVELAKMRREQKEVEFAKRGASELPNLAGTDVAKGKLLEAVEGDEELLKTLKAADAVMAKAMSEMGHTPMDDESSATFKLDKMARDHMTAHSTSFEVAYAEVSKAGEGYTLWKQAQTESN
jgi:hypothetical protein